MSTFKRNILISVVLLLSVFLVYTVDAKAQGQGNGIQNQEQNQEQNQGAENENQEQNQEENEATSQNQGNTTSNTNQEQNRERNQQATTTVKSQKGQTTAEEHRSAVANFVQNLLIIADREGGIGEQVRIIAQQQNQSASTTIQAITKVQNRGGFKTFFIGSDYKNLGVLRGEMVQTRNRIQQLNNILENVQNEGDKTELQNQITTLEQEQAKIETFIKSKDGKFSLFGWLVRLFN